MSRSLYFDCHSGISGDMTLGALVDLSAQSGESDHSFDAQTIQSAIRSMGLADVSITSEIVKKHGFRATKIHINHPPEHAHRHLHHITEMIDSSNEITGSAKSIAHRIFGELATAEARVHGSTIEKVHFHEVGAIDSIADIVGTAVALDLLDIESIVSSPVPTGHGTITIAHGKVSIPAPATAELLKGIPIAGSSIQAELTTPTGAAILKAMCHQFDTLPPMQLIGVGYGAGTKDLDEQANVLRILLGESDSQAELPWPTESDRIVVLETNLDDCSPQQIADAAQRLMDAGALDVFQTPCVMKKGRSGVVLTVLTSASRAATLESIVFSHTTSIGIRRHSADRHKLIRRMETVETSFGPVRGKVVELPESKTRFFPEDNDVTTIAAEQSTTADTIRQAAIAAWKAPN